MRISEIEDWRVSQRKGVLRQAISDLKYHNIGQFLHTRFNCRQHTWTRRSFKRK